MLWNSSKTDLQCNVIGKQLFTADFSISTNFKYDSIFCCTSCVFKAVAITLSSSLVNHCLSALPLHHCLSPPTPSPSWSFSSHSLHHRLSPPTPSIILCPLSMPLSSPSEIKFGVDQPDGHDDLHYIYSLKDFQAFTSSTYEGMFDRAIRTVQVYVCACE